jgi:hypothetical protein
MNAPSGISRRIRQCSRHIAEQDWEAALINLYPAIDHTAKKRRPKAGVGERIKAFLTDEETLISVIATGGAFKGRINGVTVPEALYKICRTSIVHEGQLDPRLQFNTDGMLLLGQDKWHFPKGYILGMTLAVVIAPENVHEAEAAEFGFSLGGSWLELNSLWGQKVKVQQNIAAQFGVADLFEDSP